MDIFPENVVPGDIVEFLWSGRASGRVGGWRWYRHRGKVTAIRGRYVLVDPLDWQAVEPLRVPRDRLSRRIDHVDV